MTYVYMLIATSVAYFFVAGLTHGFFQRIDFGSALLAACWPVFLPISLGWFIMRPRPVAVPSD